MLQIFIGLIIVVFMSLFIMMSLPMLRDNHGQRDEGKSKQQVK